MADKKEEKVAAVKPAVELFKPLKVRDVTFKNRIGLPPMAMFSSVDGAVSDFHLANYGARALGGCGLIICEVTAIAPEGRISPGDLGAWKDDHIAGLTRLAKHVEQCGAVPGIQIGHAGRKASTGKPWVNRGGVLSEQEGGWRPMAPSPIPFSATSHPDPREMTKDDIKKVTEQFVATAERVYKAGFKVLEIHAAHGFLLSEFLSPLTNFRKDEYGGSFENRTRLLREIVVAVRKVWPDTLPLIVRLSCVDWAEGGVTEADSIALSAELKKIGVDVINCSSGGVVSTAKYNPFDGYQVSFAENIRKKTGILTMAVGMIRKADQAEDILKKEQADFILVGREMLRDPNWALHAAISLGCNDPSLWPNQYAWCVGRG